MTGKVRSNLMRLQNLIYNWKIDENFIIAAYASRDEATLHLGCEEFLGLTKDSEVDVLSATKSGYRREVTIDGVNVISIFPSYEVL